MMPFIVIAEKKQKIKLAYLIAILLTALSQIWLAFDAQTVQSIWLWMFLYFVSFNILEATLPSLVSKTAESHSKGTAMGIYSSCQFLGIFAGGLSSGLIYSFTDKLGVFILNLFLSLLWFLSSLKLKTPINK